MHLILSPIETERKLNWDNAIEYCENLTIDGYTDWKLPSLYELGQLVHEYPLEFNKDDYWTRTERWYESPGAHFINCESPDIFQSCWKEHKLLVRAVRKATCEICK